MEINWFRFVLDFLAFAVVLAPSFYFRYYGENVTFKRGFFCDDPDLRYPKRPETYTGKVVWTVACLVPLSTILLNEMFIYYKRKQLSNGKLVKIFAIDVYKKMLVYVFGMMGTHAVTLTFKHAIGRLRPHFFDYCKPRDPLTGVLLSNCSNLVDKYQYIENYVCSTDVLNNVRLSFFSGHATTLSFQYIYFLLYTQNNVQLRTIGLIRPLVQTGHLMLSVYLTISRIFDYYHHPSDLVFGGIVGVSGAILTYYFLSEYTESYWLKDSQFLYSYDDEHEFINSEQIEAAMDSEAQKISRKKITGKDLVDKKRSAKRSNILEVDEKTALLSSKSN